MPDVTGFAAATAIGIQVGLAISAEFVHGNSKTSEKENIVYVIYKIR